MTSEAGMTDGTGGEGRAAVRGQRSGFGPHRPVLCVLTLGNF